MLYTPYMELRVNQANLKNVQEGLKLMGYPAMKATLDAVFDQVKDSTHWKNPIDATIQWKSLELVHEAVVFMTGSIPKFTDAGSGPTGIQRVRVQAIGYFKAVGA